MKVVFHPEAYDEMLESARFYEARSKGLGLDFLSAVEDATHKFLSRFSLVGFGISIP